MKNEAYEEEHEAKTDPDRAGSALAQAETDLQRKHCPEKTEVCSACAAGVRPAERAPEREW